jgi:hypothetical protein
MNENRKRELRTLAVRVAFLLAVGTLIYAMGYPGWIRAKVTQDKASLRTIATALESYYMDWNFYPDRLETLPVKAVFDPPVPWLGGRLVDHMGPYLPSVPRSSFGERQIPHYHTKRNRTWILWTVGPAEEVNLVSDPAFEASFNAFISHGTITPWIIDHMYDPTNGTFSIGAIIRWKS